MNAIDSTKLFGLALLAATAFTSCAAKLNEVVTKLPKTEEYSKPMTKYTVNEVVKATKPLYDNVYATSSTIELLDRPKQDSSSHGFTITESSLSLGHDGHKLNGGYSSTFKMENR